jgi:hypothetical protein
MKTIVAFNFKPFQNVVASDNLFEKNDGFYQMKIAKVFLPLIPL